MSTAWQLYVILPGTTEEREFGLPSSEAIARKRAEILCHHTAGLRAVVRRLPAKEGRKGGKNGKVGKPA